MAGKRTTKYGLTEMQMRFVEAFRDDAQKAAKEAGYAYWATSGAELMRDARVLAAIADKHKGGGRSIAKRHERRQFWTRILRDERFPLNERLKASELLGKSEADFTDKVQQTGDVSIRVGDPYDKPKDTA